MDKHPNSFNPDTIHEIFKVVWSQTKDRAHREEADREATEVAVGASKKSRTTTEAIQRAAIVAEAEGITEIEGTHLERILPQLLLDF